MKSKTQFYLKSEDVSGETKISTLFLIPFGEIPASVLSYLKKLLEERFGCEVGAGEHLPLPRESFNPAIGQYNSSLVLNKVRKNLPAGAKKALGIIDVDLYVPGLNYVFGQADLSGCCALISLARLRPEFYNLPPDPGLFYQRIAKEAVHEMGHTMGLSHCSDVNCVMHFSNSLDDTDRKSSYPCPNCTNMLQGGEREKC